MKALERLQNNITGFKTKLQNDPVRTREIIEELQ